VSPAFSAISLKFASPALTALFAAEACGDAGAVDCECAITLNKATTLSSPKIPVPIRARKLTKTPNLIKIPAYQAF
jgi:hypothetical protein